MVQRLKYILILMVQRLKYILKNVIKKPLSAIGYRIIKISDYRLLEKHKSVESINRFIEIMALFNSNPSKLFEVYQSSNSQLQQDLFVLAAFNFKKKVFCRIWSY